MAAADSVLDTVNALYVAESRRVLATLIRLIGDFDAAEEALHDGDDKMTHAEALKEIVRATEQLKMIQKLRKVKG